MTERGRQRAAALAEQGLTKEQIAAELRVRRRVVHQWLARHPVRTCLLCGRGFVPTNGRQRFCTKDHWRESKFGERVVRSCRHCGQEFVPTNGRQHFCTPAHRREAARLRDPRTIAGWRARVEALERDVAQARAELEAEGARP